MAAAQTARRARGNAGAQGSTADAYGKYVARAARLRYVSDADTGLTRARRRGKFVYLYPDGRRVADSAEISRINALAIPPAYEEVWICREADGHLQATGRDARGRKQYRYHPRWQTQCATAKYARMQAFGHALPRLRRRVARLLRLPGMPREKVLAAVVQLLDVTLIRIGNDEYARHNRSYGLTTLCTRHVEVSGTAVHFDFRGKGGIEHQIMIRHPVIARIVKVCLELPGRELFQYLDDEGGRRVVTAADVNAFIRQIAGADFSAKDYRTWAGSVLALSELGGRRAASQREATRNIVATAKIVAERLGNTPAICRKSYIHPAVLEAYRANKLTVVRTVRYTGLRADEAAFLDFLGRLHRHQRPAKILVH